VFKLQIPKDKVARVAPAAPLEPGVGQLNLHGQRVLVVDDDPLVRDALAAALTAWGAQVSLCGVLSELEGLLAQKPEPDIAIIDFRLAEGPMGLEVAHQMHGLRPGIKRVMMTGELLLDPRLEDASMPILRKPVSHQQLARVLERLVTQA
jgi:DNA-binding NtrC family response regulator